MKGLHARTGLIRKQINYFKLKKCRNLLEHQHISTKEFGEKQLQPEVPRKLSNLSPSLLKNFRWPQVSFLAKKSLELFFLYYSHQNHNISLRHQTLARRVRTTNSVAIFFGYQPRRGIWSQDISLKK
jgi:hypothetical protein